MGEEGERIRPWSGERLVTIDLDAIKGNDRFGSVERATFGHVETTGYRKSPIHRRHQCNADGLCGRVGLGWPVPGLVKARAPVTLARLVVPDHSRDGGMGLYRLALPLALSGGPEGKDRLRFQG